MPETPNDGQPVTTPEATPAAPQADAAPSQSTPAVAGPTATASAPTDPPPAAKAAAPAAAAPTAAPAAPKPAPAPPKPAPVPWQSETVDQLKQAFGEGIRNAASYLGQNYLVVDRSVCHDLIRTLRDQFGFKSLTDVTAVHYPKDAEPFEIVWILYCMAREERVRIKARFAETDEVPSITDLWVGANWLEREVYDMFGVRFSGHPDLRRILMPDEWTGHPLRKDYGVEQQDKAWVQKNLGIESGQ